MNRNAATTGTRDASKRHKGNTCWSSEWSFIEDSGVTLQKQAHFLIAEKQPAGDRVNISPDSS